MVTLFTFSHGQGRLPGVTLHLATPLSRGEEDLSPREARSSRDSSLAAEAVRGLAESFPGSKEDFLEKPK